MADWQAIKADYITGTSGRKLAKKYGVAESTIFARSSKENWEAEREQHRSDTVAEIIKSDIKKKVSSIERLETVADKVLDKVEAYIDACDPTAIDTQSLKHISGVLKDIKDVKRNRKDLEEQDARIANFRRQSNADATGKDVVVEMSEEVDELSG